MNENLKNIFIEQFLKQFDDKEQKKILLSREQQTIVERKNKRLNLIRQFLDQFVEQGVKVYHRDRFNKKLLDHDVTVKDEQVFKHYDADASDTWAPGISILFDHPAEVEIAVPNDNKEGFYIKVASPHPKDHLLNQHYENVEAACQALANFIYENTTSVNPDYKRILKEYDKENNLAKSLVKSNSATVLDKNFFSRAPLGPPETVKPPAKETTRQGNNGRFEQSVRTFGQFAHTQPVKNDTRQADVHAHAKENNKENGKE